MNLYIKSNLATKEVALSISSDREENMKAILGEEISDVVEASEETKEAAVSISDNLEGNMKAVLGEEISDVVEASASADASTAMAVTMLAAAVSSVVAGNMNAGPGDKKLIKKKRLLSMMLKEMFQKKG
jgi:hypothetical protein